MDKQKTTYLCIILGIISVLIFTAAATTDCSSNDNQQDSTFVVSRQIYIPEKVTLFGERVPLELYDVYESLERELLVNTFYHKAAGISRGLI